MKITHLGHAAVLVEVADARMLIDPGNLSDAWHQLRDLDAIFVTHQHPDHVDVDHGRALVSANPQAVVAMEEQALASSALSDQASVLHPGAVVQCGAARVTVVGGQHAVIHQDIPRIGNVGLVITAPGEPTFFHPGDALDVAPEGIDVLAVPSFTPWAAMKEVVDFARAVGAPRGFGMHEGGFNEVGFALLTSRVAELAEMQLVDLRDRQPYDFSASSAVAQ